MNERRSGRWGAFGAVFVAAVVCAINQFKVPPVLGDVQVRFGVSLSAAGWVSSVYALSILLLAVPGALMVRRLGLRNAALAGMAISGVASIGGVLAPNAMLFVVLRVLEGVGQALVFVIGPTLVSELFAPEERGLPLGIFNCAIPVAVVIAYNLAVPLRDALGLWSIWVFSAMLLALDFALVWLFVPVSARAGTPESESSGMGWSAWTNQGIVLCCCAMCGSGFRDLAYATWAPSYYAGELGLAESAADYGTSMEYVGLVMGSLVAGVVVDRVPSIRRKAVMLAVVEILTLFASTVGFALTPGVVVAYMVFLGLLVGANVTLLYALLGSFARSASEQGMGAAMMTVFLSVGQLLGPPASGALVSTGGWGAATVATVGSSAIMIASAILLTHRAAAQTGGNTTSK